MAKVAILSMRRYGYADSLAAATRGTMGIVIPPGAAMIMHGILTEQDVGALLAANRRRPVTSIAVTLIGLSGGNRETKLERWRSECFDLFRPPARQAELHHLNTRGQDENLHHEDD